VLGVLRPAAETPEAEASLGFPGGIAALPSAAPAIPGLSNQSIPAIIGTGQPGIVAVFCFHLMLPIVAGNCPGYSVGEERPQPTPTPPLEEVQAQQQQILTGGAITFELERLYPPDSGPPGLTFDANGLHTLVVSDNSGADQDIAWGVVTVQVNAAAATLGGTQGVNEIVGVSACDETGDCRATQIIVVDTILAFGPTGPLSTAAQEQPMFVSYHCDVTGRAPLAEGTMPWAIDPDFDGNQGLDDMYDGYYTPVYDGFGPAAGYGTNSLTGDLDLPDVWCGGNTAPLFDDFVSFQTDMGLFSINPVGQALQAGAHQLSTALGYFYPPVVDAECEAGKSVNVFDVDALAVWAAWLSTFPGPTAAEYEGGCDADGWRNGVVSMMLLGTGEAGRATITAQQGGGISPPRTIGVTFVGEAAISLFLKAPKTMGVEGGEFTVVLVDSSFRPVGNESISCLLEPTESGLIIVPQTGTTGSIVSDLPGQVLMRVVPTGAAVAAGETLIITCRVDRRPNIAAVAVVTLAAYESESVDLVAGCNPLASTWPDGAPIETVAGAVSPAEALAAIWAFDPESGLWQGYSPAAPEVSDLTSVNLLDAIFICMSDAGTVSRPVIPTGVEEEEEVQ
jgi:hypothetical protein